MSRFHSLLLAIPAFAFVACASWSPGADRSLATVLDAPHRTEAFRARDVYRHPKETLEFFGLRRHMTVVEVWPGGGWYTEILAPYLRKHGRYYAAGFVVSWKGTSQYRRDIATRFHDKLQERPDLYDEVKVTELGPPGAWVAAPPASADLVLTFRNVHNWVSGGYEREMFEAFAAALKPGGTLGVVEHRAAPGTPLEEMKKSGYVTEDYVKDLAEAAGFELVATSEINANPRDTRDHPEGVWTLPPTLRLGEQDREKYLAIGESDRMTLRFVKPVLVAPQAYEDGRYK